MMKNANSSSMSATVSVAATLMTGLRQKPCHAATMT